MQSVGANLLAVLQSPERDLVDLFEFYDPSETNLTPIKAAARFCETTLNWNGQAYSQYAISRGDISRYVDGRFNTVSVTLSNVDRVAGGFVAVGLEGYRLIIRMISRRVNDDSLVLGVFRCEKPFDVDNTTVQIQAKQDLGSIENDLPWRTFAPKCQVAGGFKQLECLAGEALGAKSAAYQAAATCNLSHAQCTEYVNAPAFQGFRFNGKKGNFKVSQRRGGAGGALLGLLGFGNKKVTKQWSNQDDVPYGKPIPLGFGRTQIELIPTQHADTGQFIAGQSVVGEGELTALLNVRNVTAGFAFTFQDFDQHEGKFGTDASQIPTKFFMSADDRLSHTAYVEYTIKGDNPDTGDSAPTLVSVVLWLKIPKWNGSIFTGSDWSDNGPEILRQLLVEPRSLNYNSAWINDASFGAAVDVCNQPMLDTTGGEDFYVSTASGTAGTDFKRYRSTGLLDTFHFRKVLGLDSTYPAERETTYNTFNAAAPPATITPSTLYRRRYTCNFHLKEKVKAADFIFKSLLPSFRGYLITGADGKLQLRIEQPPPTSLLRNDALATATALQIEDAKAWKTQSLSVYFALVGVGLDPTSETVRVTSIDYSVAGNSITLSASAVGGGITATASGATLSGGSTSVQASGTVTMGGTPAVGNTVTITIDGVAVGPYTLNTSDTTGTVAGIMAARINANTTLNRYIEAIWDSGAPTVVTIKSKLGTLNLAAGVAFDHFTAEQVIQIHMPFAHSAFGALSRGNVLQNTFKWPLGGKQSSFNQFVLIYTDAVQDFQETEVRENDYAHQAKINKINKLEIDGACVDNYHQADRLLQATRYKYRDGDFFCGWGSAGQALLLEEGDYVAVNHGSMPRRNLPLRLEEVKVSQDHRVSLVGRLYADAQHPTGATPKTVPLTTGVGWPTAAPGAVTGLSLTQPSKGTIRGTFTFSLFSGTQFARVEVDKPGGGVNFVDMGLIIKPDASGNGSFEISGLPAGSNDIRIISVNQYAPTATSTSGTSSIVVDATLTAEETDGSPTISSVDKLIFHKDSLTDLGSADAKYTPVIAIEFIIDGGAAVITTGQKGHLEIPIDCEILQWTLAADQSGSIVIDIWRDTYANFPPTVADSITASAKPTLSSQQKNQDSTLTGWSKTITMGDILAFNVDSVTTVQRVVLSLKCRRT